ncbi:MAG: hypothetical protein ACK5LT_12765 [Lachnospirales bacterium]
MKKIIYVLLSLLQVLSVVGAFLIHYFTLTKMGMARYVVYLNNKIMNYPVEDIINLSIGLILILTLYFMIKVKNRPKLDLSLISFFNMIFLGHAFLGTVEDMRSYYLVMVLLFITAIIQMAKIYWVGEKL